MGVHMMQRPKISRPRPQARFSPCGKAKERQRTVKERLWKIKERLWKVKERQWKVRSAAEALS